MSASFPKTFIVVVVLALALVGLMAGTAFAAPPYDGAAFGQHVSTMAQGDCLCAEHNPGVPGVHQGITGWHGPCSMK